MICQCCKSQEKVKSYPFKYGMFNSTKVGHSRVESRGMRLVEVTPTKIQKQYLGESTVYLCDSCIEKDSLCEVISMLLTGVIGIAAFFYFRGKWFDGNGAVTLAAIIIIMYFVHSLIIAPLTGFILQIKGDGSVKSCQDKAFEAIKESIKDDLHHLSGTCMILEREKEGKDN